MNQEPQLFTNEEQFLKIKNLYEWLDINEDDREKYNSFNLKELNELCRILQEHKKYREGNRRTQKCQNKENKTFYT